MKKTKHLQIILFTDLTDSTEVSKRLGHLAVVNVQECIVHPVFCKRNSIAAFTLCDLIFMMREDQILAACVDIDGLARCLRAMALHSMCQPGRPSHHGEVQYGSPSFFRFPEYEIQRIFFLVLS